ncbi:multidrug effflux MFS transporter [Aliagarivorans taiwanensis]|uniref:multidrug effflux MFS transporter n=1 Tax=Aliagarivorans taiwanensis TaxID=561966 RepID=UPI000409D8A9|nr:multidrug effflux MFS transporter [Aliagarivorans taiwanensis]
MSERLSYKPVLLASLIVSIGQLSMGLVFPSLPWIAKDFNISLDEAQLLISLYLLGFGPSQFIYGPISDALGRRRVLLVGLLLALLGLSLAIFGSQCFGLLLAGRFVQGLGAGCCAVLGRASLRDNYSPEQLPRALSVVTMVASFTPIVAPVFGGLINHHLGWLAVFVSLFSYIALVWLVLYLLFKETISERRSMPKPAKVLSDYGSLIRSRYFQSFAVISWLNFSLVITAVSLMPFVMQNQIGMNSQEYAYWALLPACGLMCGGVLCNRLLPLYGQKRILFMAPWIHLSAGLWLINAPLTPLAMMFGQFLMAMGNGLALPCAQAKVLTPYRQKAGTAAALSGGGQMIFSSLISMTALQLGMHYAWQFGYLIVAVAVIGWLNVRAGFKAAAPGPALNEQSRNEQSSKA